MFARTNRGAVTGVSTTRVLAVLAAAGTAGVVLAGCTPDQHPTDAEGTTPPVITGDQARPGDEVNAGTTTGGAEAMSSVLRNADGSNVGAADFALEGEAVSVTLRVTGMEAGEHMVHVHEGTKCEAGSAFATAGDHLMVDGEDVGALPAITVLENGTGTVTTVVDSFDLEQIRGKTIVVHEGDTRVACGQIAEVR